MATDPIDHDGTDAPVCPFCGRKDYDWQDGAPSNKEDWSVWCPVCDREFRVSRHITVTFTTSVGP